MMWILILLAAVTFLASLAVHVAALAGCDVLMVLPGAWVLHVVILALWFAAVVCGNKELRTRGGGDSGDALWAITPRWLKVLFGCVFVYAILNFVVAALQTEGEQPRQLEDGRFALTHGSRVVRELTEDEYRRYRSYEARAFSGHWLVFSGVATLLLVGAAWGRRRRLAGEPFLAEPPLPSPEPARAEKGGPGEAFPRPAPSLYAALGALSVIVLVLAMIRTFHRGMIASASLVCIPFGVLHVVRQARREVEDQRPFETVIGCLAFVPSIFLALLMTWFLHRAVYVAVACGIGPAMSGEVTFTRTETGPRMLSNGQEVIGALWTGIHFVVWPVGVLLGLCGLLFLADTIGYYVGDRLRRKPPYPCPQCGRGLRSESD